MKKFISIEEMKEKLEKSGYRNIWNAIEKIGNWQERIANRQLFFLAGGSLELEQDL